MVSRWSCQSSPSCDIPLALATVLPPPPMPSLVCLRSVHHQPLAPAVCDHPSPQSPSLSSVFVLLIRPPPPGPPPCSCVLFPLEESAHCFATSPHAGSCLHVLHTWLGLVVREASSAPSAPPPSALVHLASSPTSPPTTATTTCQSQPNIYF